MPATISSCLNSCGLCGRAYQLPGCSRAGTRKSRAPSGVERVSVGVSTSTKPCVVEHVAGGLVDLAAQAQCRVGAGAAQVEVAVARAAPPRPPRRGRRSGTAAAAAALSTSTSVATTSTSPVGRSGFWLPSGRRLDLAGDLQAVLAAQVVGDLLVADDDLDDAAGLAQVDERHSAVVATARHPAGEGHLGVDVLGRRLPASWVRITVLLLFVALGRRGRRSSTGGVQVAGSAATCSPLRMSLTSAACRRRRGTRRTGCRAARRTGSACRTSAALAATSEAMPLRAQRSASAVAGGPAAPRRRRPPARRSARTGRRRRRPCSSSGTSTRLTPSEMPTPGYVVRPSVASAS